MSKTPLVCDREGNRFRVRGFTYSLEGRVNGFYLISESGRGEKEIALSDAKFFRKCRKRRRR